MNLDSPEGLENWSPPPALENWPEDGQRARGHAGALLSTSPKKNQNKRHEDRGTPITPLREMWRGGSPPFLPDSGRDRSSPK